jgi:hypothetical protein
MEKKTDTNWVVIESIMSRSIRGTGVPTPEELRQLERALSAEPKQYASLHRQVKEAIIREISMMR